MATLTKSASLGLTSTSWALPLAAMILVAGSLVFWACVGLFWLAIRQPQSPDQPIVIWVSPAAGSAANDERHTRQVQPTNTSKGR
jgi:hypothetical protein